MTRKEVGKSFMEIGTLLLVAPFLLILAGTFLYFISLIEFTILTLIIIGGLIYFIFSVGLILYGKKLMEENDW